MGLLRLFKGGETEQRISPAGATVIALELDQFIARGYGRMTRVGSFSTPITGGGAGTIIDIDQPEFCLAVPPQYVAIPLRISVQCQAPLLAADNDEMEILIMSDRAVNWPLDGTFTGEATVANRAQNMRTDIYPGSACRLGSAFTANMTKDGTSVPTGDVELARAVKVADVQTAVGVMWTSLELVYEPKHPLCLVGPSNLYIYWGGTVAVTGFAQIAWIEGHKNEIFL